MANDAEYNHIVAEHMVSFQVSTKTHAKLHYIHSHVVKIVPIICNTEAKRLRNKNKYMQQI
jgi:hypothetical protein